MWAWWLCEKFWRLFIWRFFWNSPIRQILLVANKSQYTVIDLINKSLMLLFYNKDYTYTSKGTILSTEYIIYHWSFTFSILQVSKNDISLNIYFQYTSSIQEWYIPLSITIDCLLNRLIIKQYYYNYSVYLIVCVKTTHLLFT